MRGGGGAWGIRAWMAVSLERIARVAGSTLLSRVLGLVRDLLAARVFGASELHSAFLTAYTLPNLFRRLLGEGALAGAFTPVLAGARVRGGDAASFALANRVFSWLLVVTGAIVVVGIGLLELGTWVPGAEERWVVVAGLAQVLLPYVVFACTAALQAAALNVHGSFAAPALGQVWLNLSMIVSLNVLGLLLAETAEGRMAWLCGGVLVGGALQLGIPAVTFWRLGWRPRFDLRTGPEVREIALLLVPSLAGTAIYQVNLAASRFLAYDLDGASTTLLFLASRLMELPIGLFSVAIATVVFPVLAEALVRGDEPGFRRAFGEGLRLTALVTLPSAAGLALLAAPIVRVLFQRDAFGPGDAAALAPVVAVFAAGLPFFALTQQATRAFHAAKDTRTPVVAAAWSFVVNLTLSLLLPRWFGTAGLAAASNVSVLVQAVVLVAALARRHPGLVRAPGLREVAGFAAALAGMCAVAAGGWRWWSGLAPGAGAWAEAAALIVVIAVSAAVYGGMLLVLRVLGTVELWRVAVRRLRGRGAGGQSSSE